MNTNSQSARRKVQMLCHFLTNPKGYVSGEGLVISGAPAALERRANSQHQVVEAPDPSDNYHEMEYETIPELITIAQLRQRLLSIRKDVALEFSLTSDSQNLLSEKIINEMLLLGVNNIQDWKKLPSTTELQMDDPALC